MPFIDFDKGAVKDTHFGHNGPLPAYRLIISENISEKEGKGRKSLKLRRLY